MKEKNNNGITLIALVITIVVLLILAGISLNLVLGQNGLITKAKDAKTQTEQDSINTETAMNNLYDEMIDLLHFSQLSAVLRIHHLFCAQFRKTQFHNNTALKKLSNGIICVKSKIVSVFPNRVRFTKYFPVYY